MGIDNLMFEDFKQLDLNNKTILITGGTGSFGRRFASIVLSRWKNVKLIVFSRDELKQYEMRQAGLNHDNMRYFIGDVRDVNRLRRAFRNVDIVVHAAALKQVPACEYNPHEAILTNIIGAQNVIEAALDCNVSKIIALSTDKAAAPVNLYGATKLVSEKLFVQANSYSGQQGTRFACVRYGNVVGSRGSVVPLFKKQLQTGTITITDKRMTRFWITLEQGVRFVLSSLNMMSGGEVFVPKLPSMNIMDLATAIAPECDVKFIGIRPGEKLHEAMISVDEAPQTLALPDRYVLQPAHAWWGQSNLGGEEVPDGFSYVSNVNDNWLSNADLIEMAAL